MVKPETLKEKTLIKNKKKKDVDMRIFLQYLLLSGAVVSLVSSCSVSEIVFDKEMKELPQITHTNMSETLSCIGEDLEKANTKNAYVFLIRDIVDGTVRGNLQNGPLSDSGRIQLMNGLSQNTYSHLGVVTDNFPLIFRPVVNQQLGLDEYARPDQKKLKNYLSSLRQVMNRARSTKKMPAVRGVIPLIVSGSFTRLDTDKSYQKGSGKNAGTRSDDSNASVDFGNTSSAKALSLVVNLVDPNHNIVVASQSFDIQAHNTNKKFRLRFSLGDGFLGFSKNEVVVEGLHGAQQTLIDAATIWILHRAYNKSIDFSQCVKDSAMKLLK